jgi:phosphatidylserine/phosphatidylglycerophosphate/cardiolipin synthase-like enzyme
LGRLDDVEELATRVVAADQEIADARQELESVERADTRQVLLEKIAALEEEKRKVEAERDARKAKYLWTPEIRNKLWEALETAKERLLILSGWISSEIVNDDFLTALRAALRRGVRVWIGYGFDKGNARGEESRRRRDWQEAEDSLKAVHKEFSSTFVYRDVARSHEKRLICDNRFTFGGSFNLLSFSGEQRGRGKLRHEGADLIEDPEYCEELYQRYLSLFLG